MADFEGNTVYAKYDNFRIGNAGTKYKLFLGSYSGDAGEGNCIKIERKTSSYTLTRVNVNDCIWRLTVYPSRGHCT